MGVASAVALGGAGAVFWMWVGAFFGMMLKFSEAALAVKYKGGANVYIEKAFGGKRLSAIWCCLCVIGSFGGGNMVQSHFAAVSAKEAFGIPSAVTGGVIALCGAFVLFFGARAITRSSAFLVPFMAVLYVFGCAAVLFVFRGNVFSALGEIFSSAFEINSLGGGISGIFVSEALRVGIAKGTFTHEAGMGSASLAHAESGEKEPVIQGCWGIIEVFIDTIFVCTLTALVILSAGGDFSDNSAAEVFRGCFGIFGDIFLSVSMFLFALAAIIGWGFYGEKALFHLTKNKSAVFFYKAVFCAAIFYGSFGDIGIIWSFSDIFNGLMIFPNIVAIIFLFPEILKITKSGSAD